MRNLSPALLFAELVSILPQAFGMDSGTLRGVVFFARLSSPGCRSNEEPLFIPFRVIKFRVENHTLKRFPANCCALAVIYSERW